MKCQMGGGSINSYFPLQNTMSSLENMERVWGDKHPSSGNVNVVQPL